MNIHIKKSFSVFGTSVRLSKIILVAIVVSFGTAGVLEMVHLLQLEDIRNRFTITANKVLSEVELQTVVKKNHLTVFWAGPESAFNYLLDARNPREISLKYVPRGVDPFATSRTFREILTVQQKDAFKIIKAQDGGLTCQNFVNGDGNAVHLNSAKLGLIYVGIKGKDIQVVMYDPDAPRNLSYACQKDGIVQVGKS